MSNIEQGISNLEGGTLPMFCARRSDSPGFSTISRIVPIDAPGFPFAILSGNLRIVSPAMLDILAGSAEAAGHRQRTLNRDVQGGNRE